MLFNLIYSFFINLVKYCKSSRSLNLLTAFLFFIKGSNPIKLTRYFFSLILNFSTVLVFQASLCNEHQVYFLHNISP